MAIAGFKANDITTIASSQGINVIKTQSSLFSLNAGNAIFGGEVGDTLSGLLGVIGIGDINVKQGSKGVFSSGAGFGGSMIKNGIGDQRLSKINSFGIQKVFG
jgi:hypothetical protein